LELELELELERARRCGCGLGLGLWLLVGLGGGIRTAGLAAFVTSPGLVRPAGEPSEERDLLIVFPVPVTRRASCVVGSLVHPANLPGDFLSRRSISLA